jgi:Flp pilus assembly protein TadD
VASIDDFSHAIRLEPSNPRTHLNRAVAYDMAGRFAQAATDAEAVAVLKPDYADAWNEECFVLAELGSGLKAVSDCDKALALAPDMRAKAKVKCAGVPAPTLYRRSSLQVMSETGSLGTAVESLPSHESQSKRPTCRGFGRTTER